MRFPKYITLFRLRWLLAITLVSVTWLNFNQVRWDLKNVIIQDVQNYYSYLPALFYEHDLSFAFLNDTANRELEAKLYLPNLTPEGKPVIKTSMGMAISYLPFFGMAHLYCAVSGSPKDGFSEPYQAAVLFSTLFYYLIGLVFCWKVLRHYFTESITFLTLFCITFATNVFFYLSLAGGMAHTVGFAGVALFLYLTLRWYKNKQLSTALCLGALAGFLTLVRPINLLVVVFFFLYDLKSVNEIPGRLKLLFTYWFQFAGMGLCGFLVFLPQLLYWKYATGSYIFNSYVGEHFYFNHPHLFKAFFGFRKGWLIYTPVMLFALAGFFVLRGPLSSFLVPLLLFFAIYIYVAFSWWCWWYGGSFGQRALIDIYPLLAIPFAGCLAAIQQQSWMRKGLAYTLIAAFTLLNLFQTMQAKYNIIHYDSMTWQSYREVFFTTSKKPDREKYLRHPDYGRALKGEEEGD